MRNAANYFPSSWKGMKCLPTGFVSLAPNTTTCSSSFGTDMCCHSESLDIVITSEYSGLRKLAVVGYANSIGKCAHLRLPESFGSSCSTYPSRIADDAQWNVPILATIHRLLLRHCRLVCVAFDEIVSDQEWTLVYTSRSFLRRLQHRPVRCREIRCRLEQQIRVCR